MSLPHEHVGEALLQKMGKMTGTEDRTPARNSHSRTKQENSVVV